MSEPEPPRKRTRRSVADVLDTVDGKEEITYVHWLMKSEPKSCIVSDADVQFDVSYLEAAPSQTASWRGVRSYRDRNFLKQMKSGQQAFFYRSNCKEPGIAGIFKIVKEYYADPTQFDPESPYYDRSRRLKQMPFISVTRNRAERPASNWCKRSKESRPRWFAVDVQPARKLKRFIPQAELEDLRAKHKRDGGPLQRLAPFTAAARLSAQPLTDDEWNFIMGLEEGADESAQTEGANASAKPEGADESAKPENAGESAQPEGAGESSPTQGVGESAKTEGA